MCLLPQGDVVPARPPLQQLRQKHQSLQQQQQELVPGGMPEPGAKMSEQAEQASSPQAPAQRIELGGRDGGRASSNSMEQAPKVFSEEEIRMGEDALRRGFTSIGSVGHEEGNCRMCIFHKLHTEGRRLLPCKAGHLCDFCHDTRHEEKWRCRGRGRGRGRTYQGASDESAGGAAGEGGAASALLDLMDGSFDSAYTSGVSEWDRSNGSSTDPGWGERVAEIPQELDEQLPPGLGGARLAPPGALLPNSAAVRLERPPKTNFPAAANDFQSPDYATPALPARQEGYAASAMFPNSSGGPAAYYLGDPSAEYLSGGTGKGPAYHAGGDRLADKFQAPGGKTSKGQGSEVALTAQYPNHHIVHSMLGFLESEGL